MLAVRRIKSKLFIWGDLSDCSISHGEGTLPSLSLGSHTLEFFVVSPLEDSMAFFEVVFSGTSIFELTIALLEVVLEGANVD